MSQETDVDGQRSECGSNKFDVVIIGAGPGGLSASIWCGELGLTSIVVDQNAELGGQLLNIYGPIVNYPGVEAGSGRELAMKFAHYCDGRCGESRLGEKVEAISLDPLRVDLAGGEVLYARSIIIATGLRRRRIGVPGETELVGQGVMVSGVLEKGNVAHKRVAVIGGGDSAIENALILADYADQVYVIHRRDSFTARKEFLEQVDHLPNVESITSAVVTEVIGNGSVRAVRITNVNTGVPSELAVDNVLVRVGYVPNTDFASDVVETDDRGYILTNSNCETRTKGIYAIGDVAHPDAPTVAGAAGGGAIAAKNIFADLLESEPS